MDKGAVGAHQSTGSPALQWSRAHCGYIKMKMGVLAVLTEGFPDWRSDGNGLAMMDQSSGGLEPDDG
jgi:hypothetical protein